jgi:hypothetical protein
MVYRCMGHNRGWEEAASMFSGASVELKTCNAALLETAGKSWNEVVIIYYYVSFQKEKYSIFNREKICI